MARLVLLVSALFFVITCSATPPKPTAVPYKPTPLVIVVTATPNAEATPTVTPRPTPSPTLTPIPREPSGLGITRKHIQERYEHSSVGFDFEESPFGDGVMGYSADGQHAIELDGPSHNLESITLIVSVATRSEQVYAALYLSSLPGLVFPDWEGGSDWINSNLAAVLDGATKRRRYKNAQIEMSYFSFMNAISLTMEAK